jgi:UDP-glucose 4-epimerase
MNVLVTGGCGFIGYALTKELLLRGYNVDVIDNLSIGDEAKDVITLGANLIGGDIREMYALKDKDYKYIFHLAALSRIQPSFKHPHLTFSINVEGTKQVVDYTFKTNAKLIYSGSSSRHHNPMLSPYALTKHMGEEWIKMYKGVYGLNAEIVRFYNVYGPGELIDSHMAAVIGIFRNQIKNNQPLTIFGDGEQRRDFTHIDDIVDGLIKIAESDEKHEDAWELGTGKNYSIKEVARMFNTEVVHLPDVKGNYRETIRVNNDAIERLGWQPTDRLEQYIKSL